MGRKAFLAVVSTPKGVWESTASVCVGHEAEHRARQLAKFAFARDVLPPFMTQGISYLADSLWRAAETNGCRLVVREVEIEDAPQEAQ